jgi:hypothetical protein
MVLLIEEMNSWQTVWYEWNKGILAFMMSHTAVTHPQLWQWMILVDIMVKGTTTNSDAHNTTLQSLIHHTHWKKNCKYPSPKQNKTDQWKSSNMDRLCCSKHLTTWTRSYYTAIFLVHWTMPFIDESLGMKAILLQTWKYARKTIEKEYRPLIPEENLLLMLNHRFLTKLTFH